MKTAVPDPTKNSIQLFFLKTEAIHNVGSLPG